jgi:hypothetical protein
MFDCGELCGLAYPTPFPVSSAKKPATPVARSRQDQHCSGSVLLLIVNFIL